MNDIIGENGIVPSLLTYWVVPLFTIISSDIPIQKEGMGILSKDQMEMSSIVAESLLLTVLTIKKNPAADRTYQYGKKVLIFSERKRNGLDRSQ